MESISLAKQNKETTHTTQEELRAKLTERLYALKPIIEAGMDEYRKALKDGTFEDQDGEAEGSGEQRKLALQKKLTDLVNRAEKMRDKLDSGEELIQSTDQLQATYTHEDSAGKEVTETIEINLDQKLQEYISFYNTHNINLPKDFEDTIREIWNNNQTEIQETIEKMGFDEVLLIPAGLSVPDLHKVMTVGYADTYQGDNFKAGGSFPKVVEKTNKTRIVLIHKSNAQNLEDRPELKDTKGKKAEDFIKAGESLTLTDYLIFQRKYFEETGTHLDEKDWTWLPGSYSDSRVVGACWDPGSHGLDVRASDSGDSYSALGCRLSRSFEL